MSAVAFLGEPDPGRLGRDRHMLVPVQQDLGADFYTRRESPEQKQAWLERQLQKLHPGCAITITISPPEAALTPGA